MPKPLFYSATVTYRHTHACAHIPDPAAPRLSGGLVNSSECVCVSSTHLLNREATQRKEREADEKENGNNT